MRDVQRINVVDCTVMKCLRGLRLQDINASGPIPSLVSRNVIFDTLESGIYLASNTYGFANDSSVGCRNITVSNNTLIGCMNNGILNIGSRNCSFIGNVVKGSANAGIQQWSSVDCVYQSNILTDCNKLTFNGIGNLGDAWANIHITGNTGVDANSGDYLAILKGNTVVQCNQGRASEIIGTKLLDTGVSYPASYKAIVDSNITHEVDTEREPPKHRCGVFWWW